MISTDHMGNASHLIKRIQTQKKRVYGLTHVVLVLIKSPSSDLKALVSVHICTVWPEPLLLTYIEYGSRGRSEPIIRPLVKLDTSEWTYAISNKILCAGPYDLKM